jgi:hypothetical protein
MVKWKLSILFKIIVEIKLTSPALYMVGSSYLKFVGLCFVLL